MIPYTRFKLSDFYTISQTKLLENHTLHSGTYLFSYTFSVTRFCLVASLLYSSYMAVPPPPPNPKPFLLPKIIQIAAIEKLLLFWIYTQPPPLIYIGN